MSNRFTPAAERALNRSLTLARALGHTYIGTEHLLLGLLQDRDCVAGRILSRRGITYERTHALLLSLVGSGIPTHIGPDDLTPRAGSAIEQAALQAMKAGMSHVGSEHLLMGILLPEEGTALRLIAAQKVSARDLVGDLERYLRDLGVKEKSARGEERDRATPALKQYGTELTASVDSGEGAVLIGREEEMARLMRILCRQGKNNPCLIGEPGVGKTALVEGLADRIARGQVPSPLLGTRVFLLDLPSMIAGAKYRGEFEDRMKQVIKEASGRREILLFIDEIHTIVGAGSAEGAVDAANILKPALARGALRVIGATTYQEYHRHIEKDGALSRRFQPLILNEPTPEEAKRILTGIRPRLEEHHGVVIPDSAIERAVALSVRYLPDRFLPDKAIDLLDEAGAAMRLEREEGAEEAALSFSVPSSHAPSSRPILGRALLERLITEQTGIPVRPDSEEREQLLKLEQLLNEQILGQTEAMKEIARAVRLGRAGLRPSHRPVASLLLYGPSGVGKSETARALSRLLYDRQQALIRFDMSEYAEPHSISRLLGSPPGYVGYGEEGALSVAIRRHPDSVLLFDEIEKAHPDLNHLFLQMLEEGQVTDSEGRKLRFSGSILIFTSNIEPHGGGAGFLPSSADSGERERAGLHHRFPPELIGRLDGVIRFGRLDRQALSLIAQRELQTLARRAEAAGISFPFSDASAEDLARQAEGSPQGARALRRLIRERVEHPLSSALLSRPAEEEEEASLSSLSAKT